jgi:hypothetical protein
VVEQNAPLADTTRQSVGRAIAAIVPLAIGSIELQDVDPDQRPVWAEELRQFVDDRWT